MLKRASLSAFRNAPVMVAVRGKATLPDLPYAFNALEPAIAGQIMEIHYQKHHQT
jgi:Fe-Mn family superoxide dismutase